MGSIQISELLDEDAQEPGTEFQTAMSSEMEKEDDIAEMDPGLGVSKTLLHSSKELANFKGNLDINVSNIMKETDKTPEILTAYGALMEAARIKIPSSLPPSILEENETNPGTNWANILENVPREIWLVALPSFVILIYVLANSPEFLWFLLTVGVCALVKICSSSWELKVHKDAQSEMVQFEKKIHASMQLQSNQTAERMVAEATVLDQQRLETVRDIVKSQASVKLEMIKSNQTMHQEELRNDIILKTKTEEGLTHRLVLQNQTETEIANLQSETEKAVETLKKEKELQIQNIRRVIRTAELETDVTLKNIEGQTSTTLAGIARDKQTKELEINAATQRAKMETDLKIHSETESAATQRLNMQLDADRVRVQNECQARIREAEEQTKRTAQPTVVYRRKKLFGIF